MAFLFALAFFAVPSPAAPGADGAYPNGKFAPGDSALLSLTGNSLDPAIGFDALSNNAAITQAPALLTGPGRFSNTKKWKGTFNVTGTGGGSNTTNQWTVSQSAHATFTITLNPDPVTPTIDGSYEAVVTVDDSNVRTVPPPFNETWLGSGTITNPLHLAFDETRCIYTVFGERGTLDVTQTTGPPNQSGPYAYEWGPWGEFLTGDVSIPASGRILSGQRHLANTQTGLGITGAWNITWSLECDTAGDLHVFPFKQNDPTWRSDLYDHSTDTIWGKGCAMTSLTMAMKFAGGVLFTPRLVNTYMINFDGAYNGKSVNWPVATDKVSGKGMKFHGFRSAATSSLDDALCMGFPVIVGVNLSGGVPGHFVLVTGRQGNDFLINDPAGKHTKLSQYGGFESRGFVTPADWNQTKCGSSSRLQAAAASGSDKSSLTISADNNVDVLLIDPNGMRTGYDPATSGVVEEIPESVYFRDSLVNDQTGAPADEITHLIQVEHPAEGTYQVIVTGVHQGPYTVAAYPFSQDGGDQPATVVQGTAPTGSSSFSIQYHPAAAGMSSLGNISTRAFVQTGNNVLIGGLIVSGSEPKLVVLRALGPALSQPPFNLPNTLADPILELHDSTGALIASNDNWGSASNAAAISALGYAPPDSKESVILTSLDPGKYTAIVRGANNSTGISLVEAYDLDPAAGSKFGNISTRASVGTGADVVIAGVIVNGPDDSNVIVRALGPALTQFGVPNVLADPVLDLRDSNGDSVMTNDNWKSNQQAEIQTSGYAPPNDLESAILITLPPGNYTAILSGKNNGTGNALVEVYGLN